MPCWVDKISWICKTSLWIERRCKWNDDTYLRGRVQSEKVSPLPSFQAADTNAWTIVVISIKAAWVKIVRIRYGERTNQRHEGSDWHYLPYLHGLASRDQPMDRIEYHMTRHTQRQSIPLRFCFYEQFLPSRILDIKYWPWLWLLLFACRRRIETEFSSGISV